MKQIFLLAVSTGLIVSVAGARAASAAQSIVLKNDKVQRELAFDGQIWRTVRFARADGSDAVAVQSDEFSTLRMDSSAISLDAYVADGEPVHARTATQEAVTIRYRLRVGAKYPANTPSAV